MASISPICKKCKNFISALKSPTYRDFMIKKLLKSKTLKSHTWAPLNNKEKALIWISHWILVEIHIKAINPYLFSLYVLTLSCYLNKLRLAKITKETSGLSHCFETYCSPQNLYTYIWNKEDKNSDVFLPGHVLQGPTQQLAERVNKLSIYKILLGMCWNFIRIYGG